jgi:hypothetical protein
MVIHGVWVVLFARHYYIGLGAGHHAIALPALEGMVARRNEMARICMAKILMLGGGEA